jgi:hypothetical protein
VKSVKAFFWKMPALFTQNVDGSEVVDRCLDSIGSRLPVANIAIKQN